MSYERALTAARQTPLPVPEFDAIADAVERDRMMVSREDQDNRARAGLWMRISAALWLLLPFDALLFGVLDKARPYSLTVWALTFEVALMMLPPALVSVWGARLVRDSRFSAAILSRAIAASNLIVALLYVLSVGGVFGAVFASLLAIASARSLALLGDRGLDARSDPSSEFEPIRFRKLLIVALILAFADALTLGFSVCVTGISNLWLWLAGFEAGISTPFVLTVAASVVMAVNVWGLARLRTWALFTNMLSNVGIAALALRSLLSLNFYIAIALTVTAAAQLLLVVPVVAAALGDDQAGRLHERVHGIVRVVVAALVIVTIVAAGVNLFGPALPRAWFVPHWPR